MIPRYCTRILEEKITRIRCGSCRRGFCTLIFKAEATTRSKTPLLRWNSPSWKWRMDLVLGLRNLIPKVFSDLSLWAPTRAVASWTTRGFANNILTRQSIVFQLEVTKRYVDTGYYLRQEGILISLFRQSRKCSPKWSPTTRRNLFGPNFMGWRIITKVIILPRHIIATCLNVFSSDRVRKDAQPASGDEPPATEGMEEGEIPAQSGHVKIIPVDEDIVEMMNDERCGNILRSYDQYVQSVYEQMPNNGMLVVITGHGNLPKIKK